MLTLFLKQLTVDTSSESIRKTTNILEQNGIKYEIRTIRTRGTIGTAFDAASYARSNIAMYKGSTQPGFVYQVFVKRSDLEYARKLVF